MNDSMLTDISTALAIFIFAFAAAVGFILVISTAVEQGRESHIARCESFGGTVMVDFQGRMTCEGAKLKEVKQ